MASTSSGSRFAVTADENGQTIAAIVRRHGLAATWNDARRLVAGGKLFVDGACVMDPVMRLATGTEVELRATAPRPRVAVPGRIVHDDAHVVVFEKPSGVSSVPYETRETGTAMDLIRAHWKSDGKRASEQALHVVHRIDKDTSGLLMFAKSKLAERALGTLFRAHDIERTYLCVVHGTVGDRRIESRLVEDRGDGLRGSTRTLDHGKRAVTHVRAVEGLREATLCEVRLETGKTHQIRIHLAEDGHPLVGETVYIRDFLARDKTPIESSRLLLHAASLGFVHPVSGDKLRFESPLPREIEEMIERLRRR